MFHRPLHSRVPDPPSPLSDFAVVLLLHSRQGPVIVEQEQQSGRCGADTRCDDGDLGGDGEFAVLRRVDVHERGDEADKGVEEAGPEYELAKVS
jgi:hypothetical protein